MFVTRQSDYKYFVIFDKNKLSREQFLFKCKIRKNSFASDLMTKVYYTLFNAQIDLEREYKEYYFEEYISFESFLYNKYVVSLKNIQYLLSEKKNNEKIYYIDLFKQPDYGISELINNDFIIKLNNIFMEGLDENKN